MALLATGLTNVFPNFQLPFAWTELIDWMGCAMVEKSTARNAARACCCSAPSQLRWGKSVAGSASDAALQFWLEIVDNDIRAARVPIAYVASGRVCHGYPCAGAEADGGARRPSQRNRITNDGYSRIPHSIEG